MKRFGMIAALVWFSVVALAHQDRVAVPGEFVAEFEGGDTVRMCVKDSQVYTLVLEEAAGRRLVVHEVEYVVKEDARIVIDYLSGETVSLRDKAGKTRVVWLDKPDGLLVERGVIEEVRRDQVMRFPFSDGADVTR